MVTISISARKEISGGVMPRGRGKAIAPHVCAWIGRGKGVRDVSGQPEESISCPGVTLRTE